MTAVLVAIWLTVTVTAADVLDVKLSSPEYWAVIALAPTPSFVVASVAVPTEVPALESDDEPSKVVPK